MISLPPLQASLNSTHPKKYSERWSAYLQNCEESLSFTDPLAVSGRLTRVAGLVLEAVGPRLPVGSTCTISLGNERTVAAEVVGFSDHRLFLMPHEDVFGLTPGAVVTPDQTSFSVPSLNGKHSKRSKRSDRSRQFPVGERLLGRVLDAQGNPIDGLGPLIEPEWGSLYSTPINPLDRAPIKQVLDVGIRAINGMLTVGKGQRMGLFAGSGVGKSVLLGMMARYTEAEVIVVGLIGERGREVKEFIEEILGEDGRARSVVVAAPADSPPLMRLQGAAYATSIAEHFRDEGKNVLLIMDSLTRYAMAQREIALAIGEPPATKGYPPSVFAKLPQLVERTGNGKEGGGSITAFYTVLTEGDDQQDPIADSARAILDGHVVLSRGLAEQGHYPAIDVEASISRAMNQLVSESEFAKIREFKQLYSRYSRARDLISVGAYSPGSDPQLDRAIALFPQVEGYLQQNIRESTNYTESRRRLVEVLS